MELRVKRSYVLRLLQHHLKASGLAVHDWVWRFVEGFECSDIAGSVTRLYAVHAKMIEGAMNS